jgi:hypothetical protein
MWCPWMSLNLRECTHVPQWIQYPGILLCESYNGIYMLADLFVIVKIPNMVLAGPVVMALGMVEPVVLPLVVVVMMASV